ncbi:MAG TPA: D-alanine--D-alanine ligase [Candidatus Krumholzibacteria bacterium]|nr:D-alanine--D-alanine ligase [Candidatus Krumholzibacteria bacterium]HPD72036.1 D-alanine--D-alanine ligase [Candidatus Krumholzibacteria bacterium]HRY41031.1 D-alanine--D-alanine ligase [Candidatus Krumholzibacteria bacterium]
MHVTVLMGGDSAERDVSLRSGAAIADALERSGHRVTRETIANVREVATLASVTQADVVFPALHGGDGEDGHVQALLDLLGVPYAMSGFVASAIAMDKATTKRVMIGAGIATPQWLQVAWDRAASGPVALKRQGSKDGKRAGHGAALSLDHILDRVIAEPGFPLVVKLNDGGSSVGVEIVRDPADFAAAFARVAATATGQQASILLEQYIPGRELTATILLGRRLPLLEIRPADGFYDFGNKYTKGACEYLCPAPVHSPHYESMCADALHLYDLLGCQGTARVDFRFDGERHYCLELNTIPGMTALSLVPMAAAAVGIAFEDLVEDLCQDALLRSGGAP